MAIHLENFVSVRKLYPRVSERATSRLATADPANETERDYRDLLSEANLNYFHREHAIALQNYLALRAKILAQSHPEMPHVPGAGFHAHIEWSKVELPRLMEYSRRVLDHVGPGPVIKYPLVVDPLIRLDEIRPNPAFSKWSAVGVDRARLLEGGGRMLRADARARVAEGKLDEAARTYERAGLAAEKAGDLAAAAHLANEAAAMLTTYARGDDRARAVRESLELQVRAEQLFSRLGDAEALDVVRANRANVERELEGKGGTASETRAPRRTLELAGGGRLEIGDLLREEVTLRRTDLRTDVIQPRASRVLLVKDVLGWKAATTIVEEAVAGAAPAARQLGLFTPGGAKVLPLAANAFAAGLTKEMYQPRVGGMTLESLEFFEVVEVNFVAYFVHLYFFVLPIAIGDCHAAMGQYEKALAEYRAVLAYPFLNLGIEARYVWLKMAEAYLQWGNGLFRRGQRAAAQEKFEKLVKADLTVPLASELYQGKLATVGADVQEVVKELKGQAHAATNPRVAATVAQSAMRLRYLAEGFDFFGLAPDYAPVLRFKYLQSVATYMADGAIETERTFIAYRSTAENQKMDHMQLESSLAINQAALAIENKRMEDAALEVEAAKRTREYAEVRKKNTDDTLAEWDTKGRELTSMNAALSWAGQAANDQDIRYTGVQYDGARHDYEGTVEEFFDTVGERREWLDWELQRNRIVRQQAEAAAEVAMAQAREAQAAVRQEIQALNVALGQKRVDAAREVLEYSEDRLFDEDLWFQLAAQLQDLARSYLDAAIYAARVMERAYELEFDRRLNRIRTDYGLGGPAGLLGGDCLKRDIVSFTSDYLEHAQKKNPVRVALSLRDEFPAAFATFVATGILPFRTDLEIFDRRYPGTYRRKLKRIEVFVEGLVPLEGASGTLTCHGICSEWRRVGGGWAKHTRVMPVERMVLSSYQFRRDLAVFQPSEELLDLFENYAPQCEWTLELPRSGNNLDYEAISDVKLVVYLDADYSDAVAAHVKATYPAVGGRATVLSARFQYPDEYFRLDAERSVDFAVSEGLFAANLEALKLTAMGVRLVPVPGANVAGRALVVTRVSDASVADVVTDARGAVQSAAGSMAPFGAWKNASPVDTWRVALADGVDAASIADVQLFFTYAFSFRADGTLGP